MAATTFHLLKVSAIREDTPDCLILEFEVPKQLESEYKFQAGQYLTLRHQINGEEVRRSYSISSAPDEKNLQVAVKLLLNGKFSGYAKSDLKVGDEVEVMEPMGVFTPHKKENGTLEGKTYLGLAAGSGVTPIMSIMKTVLKDQPESTFTLVYGNRTRTSVIFKDEIEDLKNKYMGRLRVYTLFTREPADAEIFNGRLTGEKLDQLQQYFLDIAAMDEIFICGPEPMIFDLRDYLMQKTATKAHQIHIELFSSPDQPRNVPADWDEKTKGLDHNKISKVTVHVDDATYDMDLAYDGDTILDQGLNQGLDLPYSCKGGVCTTCRAKLLEGKVEMEVCYGLEQDEIDAGYILTCQSHPRTEKVSVDYDV